MKTLHTNYTFAPGSGGVGTVTLTALNITQERLLLITNTTLGTIIYNFASTALGGAVASGTNTVVTLTTSTTGQSAGDKLQIYYDSTVIEANATNQDTQITALGGVTETAPASDTASSGLNGRLQRIAQRVTSLIGQIPASLGIKTAANSLSVAPASDGIFNCSADQYAAVVTGSTLTRPADTTAYAIGDLIANSTTAGSVVPITLSGMSRVNTGQGRIERVRLSSSSTAVGMTIRVHLYNTSSITVSNGDNGAWLTSNSNYIGAFDVTIDRAFTDGASGSGIPLTGGSITFQAGAGITTLYALLEARSAFTPTSGCVFTLRSEVYRF